jgi:hypothetical protein
MPTSLRFDWLLKQDLASTNETLVLVVVDDPRRAILAPKLGAKPKAPFKLPKTPCEKCGETAWALCRDGRADVQCTTSGCGVTARRPEPAPAQSAGLPRYLPDVELLLRDTTSRWNPATGELDHVSPRLRQWRRFFENRDQKELLATDTRFPDLWAEKTRVPTATSSGASTPSVLKSS